MDVFKAVCQSTVSQKQSAGFLAYQVMALDQAEGSPAMVGSSSG